jgi:predicted lipoprotein with Yx(FWY)xxD motif
MRVRIIWLSLLAFVLYLTGCAPQIAAPAPQPTATTAPAAAPAESETSEGAMVDVNETDALGQFLVDDKGMTLYLFTKDTPNTSDCYDKCAENWPPLLTTGDPVAGDGVDGAMLGTTARTDGSMQVTYNGWPLYYYIKDEKAGDTVGQQVGDVWYVISPTGEEVEGN